MGYRTDYGNSAKTSELQATVGANIDSLAGLVALPLEWFGSTGQMSPCVDWFMENLLLSASQPHRSAFVFFSGSASYIRGT